ncbi:hypothetical protein IT417_03665 [bacterium]|nr:hypothetical protein [bacterium]
MADENSIQLKLIIDGKEAIATLKLTGDEIKNIKKALDDAGPAEGVEKTTKAVSTLGVVSKRDLGQFANQLLYTSGISGRLGGQLSGLAAGLLTGGAIGAAFAGFAGLVNIVTERSRSLDATIISLKNNTGDLATQINNYRKELEKLSEPSLYSNDIIEFWVALESVWLTMQGQGDLIEGILEKQRQLLKEAYNKIGTGEAGILGRLKDQIRVNEELRDTAESVDEVKRYQEIINQLQIQYNELLGLGNKTIKENKNNLGDTKKILEEITGGRAGIFPSKSLKPSTGSYGRSANEIYGPADFVTSARGAQQINNATVANQLFNETLSRTSSELSQIGTEGGRAWTMNLLGIQQVTSLLQILVVKFGEVLFQALLLKGASALLNFLLPGSGVAFGAFANGGSGVVTQPTLFLAGEAGPESYNFTPLDRMNKMSAPQHVVVEVRGELTQKGMDMRAVLRQVEETLRRNSV